MKSSDKKRSLRPLESSKKTGVVQSNTSAPNSSHNGSDEFSEDIENNRVTPNTASQIIMETSAKNAREILDAGYDDGHGAVTIVSEFVKFHIALLMLNILKANDEGFAQKFIPQLTKSLVNRFEAGGVKIKGDDFAEVLQLNVYDEYISPDQDKGFLDWVEKYHTAFQKRNYDKSTLEERFQYRLIYNLCPKLGIDADKFPIVEGLSIYATSASTRVEMGYFWRSIPSFQLNIF